MYQFSIAALCQFTTAADSVIIASLLFGFLYQGGAELSFELGVDRNIVVVLQGLVILFCGALEHMMRPRIEQFYLAFANRSSAQTEGV